MNIDTDRYTRTSLGSTDSVKKCSFPHGTSPTLCVFITRLYDFSFIHSPRRSGCIRHIHCRTPHRPQRLVSYHRNYIAVNRSYSSLLSTSISSWNISDATTNHHLISYKIFFSHKSHPQIKAALVFAREHSCCLTSPLVLCWSLHMFHICIHINRCVHYDATCGLI